MNRRDHAVVAVMVLLLVGLGGILALPRTPAAGEAETPSPDLTMPPPVTYREGVVGHPESVTPITARSRSERTLVGLVFSGLVRLGPADTLEPDIAESWTTDESGKVWTFRLRDDATWHDGTPVTAEDVVFTIEALRSPDAAGAMAASWAEVEARAIDDRTVQLTLQTPVAGFLAAMTQPLLPAHLLAGVPFADLGTDPFASHPVGSGPFALLELDAEQAVLTPAAMVEPREEPQPSGSLDPFGTPQPLPTSSRPVPYLERLVVRFYDDAASLATAFESGEVDTATGLPADVAGVLASADGVEALRYPTTTLSSVLLDLRPSHSELADPRVRRALLAAIDRDAIVESVMGGNGARADALVPPTSWVFDAEAAGTVKHDPKKAAELLKEAGWKKSDGAWTAPRAKEPYRVELLAVPPEANPRLAATAGAVRDAWTKLGLKVDLVAVPGADMAQRLREGSFTAAVVDIAMGLEPDLYPLLASSQVRTSGSNLSGFQDPTLDPLLEKARAPGTAEERTAAWKALLVGLAERRPILPLAWPDDVALVRGVEGIGPRLIADPGDRFWDVLGWRLATDR